MSCCSALEKIRDMRLDRSNYDLYTTTLQRDAPAVIVHSNGSASRSKIMSSVVYNKDLDSKSLGLNFIVKTVPNID